MPFHSAMSYGIMLWGNSSHSSIMFRIQIKAIRIMKGCRNRLSCRNLFKKLKILSLTSQYMLSLLMLVVKNKNFFLTTKITIQTLDKEIIYNFIKQTIIYQNGAYYSVVNIFNTLPLEIRNVAGNKKKIGSALKKFLYTYSFYKLKEYFSQL